jgi:hypothetical protein
LLTNPGRNGCSTQPSGMPVQVWATWFPRDGTPQTFIQGFPVDKCDLSVRHHFPFHFRVAENGVDENSCWGNLDVDGHVISWNLRNRSNFAVTLSDKGWIGFSKSPHSDALFSGEIIFDGHCFAGDPLGFGVQGHNCGYRHRTFWRWMHAYFHGPDGTASTLEGLIYDMPFGLLFGKAVLWHRGTATILRNLREQEIVREANRLKWAFVASRGRLSLEAVIEARAPRIHRLAYVRTDCSSTFPVSNASLAQASLRVGENLEETLRTLSGAVLEMGGIES